MLYGLATKGFRPGGPTNLVPADACADDLAALGLSEPLSEFDPDTLWNYEVGVKSLMANGRLMVNAAAYFIDWTDVQQAVRLACGFGFVGNVGAAESKGVEIDFSAQPTDNLSIFGSFGYTDAEFTETSAEVGVTAGDRITNTPEITASVSAAYYFQLSDQYQSYIQGSYRYTDEIIDDTTCCGTPIRPSYSTVDLRLGVRRNDNWEAILFVDNVTDERGYLAVSLYQPFALDQVSVIRPRTYGITLRYSGR
jgi:outer membrane receptor protein involved in Fe transport